MKGDYPCFKATYVHEELVEYFLLSPADRAVVETCHGETNRHSVAVLLKTVQYLGYFPEDLQHVPLAVRTFIAHQLHLLWDHTADVSDHRGSNSQAIDFAGVDICPIFMVKIENPEKSST